MRTLSLVLWLMSSIITAVIIWENAALPLDIVPNRGRYRDTLFYMEFKYLY